MDKHFTKEETQMAYKHEHTFNLISNQESANYTYQIS